MEKPRDTSPCALVHDRLEPVHLDLFFTLPAAEQQRIEPYETPFLDILDPSVGAEMSAPAPEPFLCDRLRAIACVADIVIAGHRTKPHPQPAHQLGAIAHVLLDAGAIHGDVGRMDNKVGMFVNAPMGERRPIVCEVRLAGAQMHVRDLNEAKSHIKSDNHGYHSTQIRT